LIMIDKERDAYVNCQTCGSIAPTKYMALYSNIGMILGWRQESVKANLCKRCIDHYFWKYTLINLTLGWWSIVSFFTTIFSLLNNTIRYIGARNLQAVDENGQPTNPSAGRRMWLLSGSLIPVAVVLLLAGLVLFGMFRPRPPAPLPPNPSDLRAPQEVITRYADLYNKAVHVYGPFTSVLEHKKDGLVQTTSTNLKHYNFIAEVRFHNPDLSSQPKWDYGLLFRGGQDGLIATDYRVYVTSDGFWELFRRTYDPKTGQVSEEVTAFGQVSDMDVSSEGSNHLLLVVSGNEAFFFVNNKYVDKMDISQHTGGNEIMLGVEFVTDDEVDSEATRYENFIAWRLP
jgi:hypothetical protein